MENLFYYGMATGMIIVFIIFSLLLFSIKKQKDMLKEIIDKIGER